MTRIAVDIDGVLTDHVTYMLEFIRGTILKDVDMTKEDVDSWDKLIGGYSFKTIFEKCLEYDDFLRNMPVIEGAVEGVNRLVEKFHVIIVTARPASTAGETYIWLRKNGFQFHTLLVGNTVDRTLLNIDVLIDDNPHAITGFAMRGGLSIVYSQPWNKRLPPDADEYIENGNIMRFEEWSGITRFVYNRFLDT